MARNQDIALTALAPMIWGSTYFVTTEFLPPDAPLTLAMMRALGAGILLMMMVRKLPGGDWIGRILVLGGLNFAIFWALLFVSAYRLPGGVAATVGSVQVLMVVFLSRALLGTPIRAFAMLAAIVGIGGVALLLLSGDAALDPLGIAAGIGGAFSMAAGTVLSRRWRAPVPALTFTAWQLTAGGLLLLPLVAIFEPSLPSFSYSNAVGLAYLSIFGAAVTYCLWIRGLDNLPVTVVSTLGFLSPLSAVVLGWFFLEQTLSVGQALGAILVLGAVWLSNRTGRQVTH